MAQSRTQQKNMDAQIGIRFPIEQIGDRWQALWQFGVDGRWQSLGQFVIGDSSSFLTCPLGVGAQTRMIYSPVLQFIWEKAGAIAELQERRIHKLQDALINERVAKHKDKEQAVLPAPFSLYKEELMSMSEVQERTGMNKWQFFAYLDIHPEYRQVDIDSFLEQVKED